MPFLSGIASITIYNPLIFIFELIRNGLINILDLNMQVFKDSYLFSKIYGLLPNDALIAAICKHYGINKIAIFDPDFKRVDFLEILTNR